jgi:uncharacterized protein YndB with AHSA1/START domain
MYKALAAAIMLLSAMPAGAGVVQSSATGFVTRDTVTVAASPADVWSVLVDPARYWSPAHSWSGNPANFVIEPRAGGCFCESLPAIEGIPVGSAEHMRVLQYAPGRLLRMRGALGPLQSEALDGVLTVTLAPVSGGTQVTWEYVVGGYARLDLQQIAPAVDQVQSEQLSRLAGVVARLRR